MNKLAISASTLLLSLFALAATSCGGSTSSDPAAGAPAQAATADGATSSALNIRYIDSDSLMTHYNLAKDFQEASMRAVSKIESARQAKAGEIQKFAAAIEQKARSNGYLSEADMQKLQKMQQDAENYLANLSRNTENELGQQQLQLNDSIENYVKVYNASKGYDAILFKAAGIYFNPSLDITRDIIDGLNARYNKVDSSK